MSYNRYWSGDGVETLGDTAVATPWWQQAITGLTAVGQSVAQIEAMRQQAKTGVVPQATLNVGVESGTRNTLLVAGAVALGGVLLVMLMKKK